MTDHTPTPWKVDGATIRANGLYVAELSSPLGGDVRDANAAFIVKAVNSHDALVKALETSAARFNMMGGVGLVNGADPKVGYRECMEALTAVVGGSR